MRLDRLAALVSTVRPDGTSPLADTAAARWSLPTGTARYVRTSATCVFAAGDAYLRLAPDPVAAATAVQAALAAAGAPVVAPRPSTAGRLVEVLDGLEVTVVAAAPGEAYEIEELAEDDAVRWGRALARLHEAGRAVPRTGLPAYPELVRSWLAPEVAGVVERDLRRCEEVLGPPDTLVHGDAQPDNARWGPAGPVFFDLDDACLSWPIAELTMAVRDAGPIDDLVTPATATPVGRALLRGYGPVPGEDLVPVFQRLGAALTYGRLVAALDCPPGPLPDLQTRLEDVAARLRTALA